MELISNFALSFFRQRRRGSVPNQIAPAGYAIGGRTNDERNNRKKRLTNVSHNPAAAAAVLDGWQTWSMMREFSDKVPKKGLRNQ